MTSYIYRQERGRLRQLFVIVAISYYGLIKNALHLQHHPGDLQSMLRKIDLTLSS